MENKKPLTTRYLREWSSHTTINKGRGSHMEITNAIYTLAGAILAAIVAGLFNAKISRDSLNQRSREQLVSSACMLATTEISGKIELMKANPGRGYGFDSGEVLIYHVVMVSKIVGDKLLNLDDSTISGALNEARRISTLRRRDDFTGSKID